MRGRHDGDYVYGFPMADGIDGVKMATEQYVDTVEPAVLRREVDAAESARMFEQNVRSRFRGVRPRAAHAAACLYTVSPDGDFVIGPHPRSDRVLVVSACSATASSTRRASARRSRRWWEGVGRTSTSGTSR